ncbi:MAG: DUF2115 domain-containing protein [Methanomicrobiales archaeon]|nr:DUF2115 domain-containing protein [Methanomicrobiales archaeon]
MEPESLRTRIAALSARMRRAPSKEALAAIIAGEVATYSLHDLLQLRASVEHDLRHVPPGYRARLQPKMMEHLFGTHHAIVAGHRKGRFDEYHGPPDGKVGEFCDLLLGIPDRDGEEEGDPRLVFLYYLIAAFTIFVCELPGHPVGTPFPGGLLVEERDGTYYCPVREKEDDVETSICPWCPAEQSTLPGDEPL